MTAYVSALQQRIGYLKTKTDSTSHLHWNKEEEESWWEGQSGKVIDILGREIMVTFSKSNDEDEIIRSTEPCKFKHGEKVSFTFLEMNVI